jgi:hypothetical protein
MLAISRPSSTQNALAQFTPQTKLPSYFRRRRSSRIATQMADLALAAPLVMGHRLTRLVLSASSPSTRDRTEFHRMGAEKIAAYYESWNAMLLALFRANLSLALSPLAFFQFWSSSSRRRRAGLSIFGAGLAPIHRRATANARRLRRRRAF